MSGKSNVNTIALKVNQFYSNPSSTPLPSLRFDRGTDDAGDAGDNGTASEFVWEVNLCSASFFSADSILWGLSNSGGLLSPSGSVLAGRSFRSECAAC